MSKHDEELLQQEYNIAIAHGKTLKDQMETKQAMWDEREQNFKTTEKLVRELCSKILSKKPDEMKLGCDYSWDSIEINELVRNSQEAFSGYVDERTSILRKIQEEKEGYRKELEQLQGQASDFGDGAGGSTERGSTDTSGGAAPSKALSPESGISIEAPEDEYMDELESEEFWEAARVGEKIMPTAKSAPVNNTTQRFNEGKEKAMEKHKDDPTEYQKLADGLQDDDWNVINAIGSKGCSRIEKILAVCQEETPSLTKAKLRDELSALTKARIVKTTTVNGIPQKGMSYFYSLEHIGKEMYAKKYNKPAKKSEVETLIGEHDNPRHGYTIRFTAEALRDTGYYGSVTDETRKHGIKLKNGTTYIPDIICSDNDGTTIMIEVEFGNHTPQNFAAKCNKMLAANKDLGRCLNFIMPNFEAIEKLETEISAWLQQKEASALKGYFIRITTPAHISDRDLHKNKNWKIVYDLSKSRDHATNF